LGNNSQQKSSLKKRDLFNSVSGEKKPQSKINRKPENMEVDDYPLASGDSGLPKPKQRNAVSFNENPKLQKTKSIGPNK